MSQYKHIEGLQNKYGDDGYLPPEFVRGDNFEDELSPILDIDEEPLLIEQSGIDPNLPRFLFSPMRDLVTRHELCGYEVIFGCTITMLKRVAYVGQNYEASRFADDTRVAKGVSETKVYERMAMYVAAGLIEEYGGIAGGGAPTGVVLLNSLFGLEPQYSYQGLRVGYAEDSRLIIDIQKRFLPYRPKTGADQLKWLYGRQAELDDLPNDMPASPRLKKDGRLLSVQEVYSNVLSEMIRSTETAIDYADVHIEQVKYELNERGLGHTGFKGRVNKFDRMVCAWADQPCPEISGRLKQDEKPQQIIVQTAAPAQAAQPVDNVERKACDTCGEMIAVTARKCRFCGEWVDGNAPAAKSSESGVNASTTIVASSNSATALVADTPTKYDIEKPMGDEVKAEQSPAPTAASLSGQQANKAAPNSQSVQQNRPGSQSRHHQGRR